MNHMYILTQARSMEINNTHHAQTRTHKYTDLNFDFEIFWLEERRICQSLQMKLVAELCEESG